MRQFTDWARKRGWWQTECVSFWRSAQQEEYAGLEQGYWAILNASPRLLTVGILFSLDQKESWLKAAPVLKERQKSINRQGINYNAEGIRRMSFVLWFTRPKIEKVEESLRKILALVREVGVGPNPVCISCGAKDHLDCYKVTHTIMLPYLLCPACAEKLKAAISSGLYRYPRKSALVKGELLSEKLYL